MANRELEEKIEIILLDVVTGAIETGLSGRLSHADRKAELMNIIKTARVEIVGAFDDGR
jgi:hypothetical protein